MKGGIYPIGAVVCLLSGEDEHNEGRHLSYWRCWCLLGGYGHHE